MVKIAHFADTHIHNLRDHEDYKYVFEQIYKDLKDCGVDYIVHAGDVVNNKVSLTPEVVIMVRDFLVSLSQIAPVIIVPGNHDGLTGNPDRLDSISAIASVIANNNIHVMYKTGSLPLCEGIWVHSLSIYESQGKWRELEIDNRNINIGVYHGTVGNSLLDTGFYLEGVPITEFSNFDYVFLGHIHKRQYVDKNKKMWFAGSTVQCGYFEEKEKGYLLWEISGKNDFVVTPRLFKSRHPYCTIQIVNVNNFYYDEGVYDIENGCNLMVILNQNIGFEEEKKLEKYLCVKYNINSLRYVRNYFKTDVFEREKVANKTMLDLSDLATQQFYLRDHMVRVMGLVDEDLIQGVLDLNSSLYSSFPTQVSGKMFRKYEFLRLEWENMFSYRGKHVFDFSSYSQNSVIGVFGENFSGKSSIFEILSFVVWGRTSKGVLKNSDILCLGTKIGKCRVLLKIDDEVYEIERVLERVKEDNVKTKLFVVNKTLNKNLLEEKKKDTEKVISNLIGTFEDFSMVSFMSQFDSFLFINEKNSGRKDILKKIFNLTAFEKSIEHVNKEIYYYDKKLKYGSDADVVSDIEKNEGLLETCRNNIYILDKEVSALEEKIRELFSEKTGLEQIVLQLVKYSSIPDVDIPDIQKRISGYFRECAEIRRNIRNLQLNKSVVMPPRWLKGQDIIAYRKKLSDYEKMLKEELEKCRFSWKSKVREIESLEQRIVDLQSKVVEKIPCVVAYESGEITDNLYVRCELAEVQLSIQKKIIDLRNELDVKRGNLDEEGYGKEIEKIEKKIYICEQRAGSLDRIIAKRAESMNSDKIRYLEEELRKRFIEIRKLKGIVSEFNQFKQNKEMLVREKAKLDDLARKLSNLTMEHKDKKSRLNILIAERGALEKQAAVLKEKHNEITESMMKLNVYKMYGSIISGKNNIVDMLFKKFLPIIEEESNSFLNYFGDMKIRLYLDDNGAIELLFSNESSNMYRSIILASGAEKMLVSLAIRCAFMEVNSLPVSNILILDEPGTAFDGSRLMLLDEALRFLRKKFAYIFLITHSDFLKDSVDVVVQVERDGSGSRMYM